MKPSLKLRQFAVFVFDVAVLYACLFLVLLIRAGEVPSMTSYLSHAYHFSFGFIGWVVIFYIARLYALDVPFDSLRFATRLGIAVSLSGLVTALYFYMAPGVPISPKTILFLFVVLSYCAILLWRRLYVLFMRLSPVRTTVGFVGYSLETGELISAMRERSYLGFDPVFLYDEDTTRQSVHSIERLSDPAGLAQAFQRSSIGTVILTDHVATSVEARRTLFAQVEHGTRFMRLQDFYEILLRRVPLGMINEAWFLERIDLRSKRLYGMFKRAIDIIVALAGMLVFLPFWPILAASIRLGSKGPVLFKQKRLGRGNKVFTIYKFRTMRVEGNDQAPTAKGDRRITALGSFMRKTRLDEVPQLLNILRGEMSFVGPRPERPELAAELEKAIPFYRQRHMVKPGITGWDQVSGEYHSPSIEDTYKKLQYDLYYLKNMSFFLDVSIFFKTIVTVLSRGGR